MRLHELLEEGIIDKVKAALGSVAGKVMGSVTSLLQAFKKSPSAQLTTIEKFRVKETGKEYLARVDTGATTCALHATDIKVDVDAQEVTFVHDGKTYTQKLLKMKTVKSANGTTERVKINLSYEWNGKIYSGIETALIDRSKLKFKLLIGRNLIKELKLPVHISNQEVED